jgi:glycosyltransferase involved in cell wall biosynthesis
VPAQRGSLPGREAATQILFYGSFIPLHGIQYIIKAAHLLQDRPDIQFIMIGSGQTQRDIMDLYRELNPRNITFIDKMDYAALITYIKQAHLCLGIFGDTDKARRVIPNKVIECMGCGKPVITGRNRELERCFKDGEDILFCNMADERDLADKILYAAQHPAEMSRLGARAREKVACQFSTRHLAERLQELANLLSPAT